MKLGATGRERYRQYDSYLVLPNTTLLYEYITV